MVTSRDILNECRKIADELEEMQDQRLVFKSLAEKCTARYSFAPVHPSDDVNKIFAVHRLVELDRVIDKRKKELEATQDDARRLIARIPVKRVRNIFIRRYVRNWSWKLIAEAMMIERDSISIRHLLRLHAKGLSYLDSIDKLSEEKAQ